MFPCLKSQLRNFVWRGFCLRGFCSGGDSPFYVTTRDDASDVLLRHNPKVALVSHRNVSVCMNRKCVLSVRVCVCMCVRDVRVYVSGCLSCSDILGLHSPTFRPRPS